MRTKGTTWDDGGMMGMTWEPHENNRNNGNNVVSTHVDGGRAISQIQWLKIRQTSDDSRRNDVIPTCCQG